MLELVAVLKRVILKTDTEISTVDPKVFVKMGLLLSILTTPNSQAWGAQIYLAGYGRHHCWL